MERCYPITLDLYQQKNYSNLVFYRLDRGNSLSISFEEKGQPLSLMDKTVLVKWQDTYRLQTRIEGDRVLVPMDGAALSETGRQELTIGLYDSENALTVQTIYYQVLEGMGDMDNIPDQPVEESVVGQLINDMTALNTAEETRMANESARKEAEAGRASAEQSRTIAEDARRNAEESRASSEQQRQTAEQERKEVFQTAEEQRATLYHLAEENRDARYQSAETQRDLSYTTAEDNRDSLYQSAAALRQEAFVEAQQSWKPEHDAAYQAAEEYRNQLYASAENFRDEQYATEENFRSIQFTQQEENRQAAEIARQQSEDGRASAETLRGDAEEERIARESNRILAEQERKDNEADRLRQETARETSESARKQQEQARTDAESARAATEQERQAAESQRQANEQTRQTAYLSMNKTFASAIANSVTGETISAKDVSPVSHPLDVTVRSKNLLNITSLQRHSADRGVSFTLTEDMGVSVSGTSVGGNTSYNLLPVPDLPVGKYTFSIKNKTKDNCPHLVIYVFMQVEGEERYYGGTADPVTVEVKENQTIKHLQIRAVSDYAVDETLYFQLEEGNTVTPHTPFITDLSAVSVGIGGGNLYDDSAKTVGIQIYEGGVTKAVESINLSGYIPVLPSSKVTINYCNRWEFYDAQKKVVEGGDITKSATVQRIIDVPETACYMRFTYHNTSDDGTSVMAVVGKSIMPYCPFTFPLSVYRADQSGNVAGAHSIAPDMHVCSNTEGVVVDMTYNIDTKTYIDQKFAALQALLLEE